MAKSLADLAAASRRSKHSQNFFSKSALEWWNTILYPATFDAGAEVTLFVTSEAMESGNPGRFRPEHAHRFRRTFTIRIAAANGEVDTLGAFGAYRTRRKAMEVAEQVATWWRTDMGLHGDEFEEWLRSQEDAR